MCVRVCDCNNCHKTKTCTDCASNKEHKNIDCNDKGVQECALRIPRPNGDKRLEVGDTN